ncbi:MAG: ATP-binding cassette domain-containing protein [Myxococcales bacterium]|nr:ATP-binding cassette domain-containing protein [Myxococcales bacterium]
MIEVEHLRKVYRVPVRGAGLVQAAVSLFRRRFDNVVAVDDVSFRVEAGECVGFLGPNGAGKTTTLKILSGLLHPTAGSVRVAGHVPGDRDHAYLRRIMLVLGQKQQLIWDLPPADTFELNRVVYDIDDASYKKTLAELTELLGLAELLTKPTRQLSLGERMKCELTAALLHRPNVLFLDEPTIGLDVSMQATLRDFIRDYCKRHGATLLLTSHYMDDVAALCSRVVVIDKGRLAYQGTLEALAHRVKPLKRMVLRLSRVASPEVAATLGTVVSHGDAELVIDVPRDVVSEAVARALAQLSVTDLIVLDPPLEDVMRELFASNAAPKAEPPP